MVTGRVGQSSANAPPLPSKPAASAAAQMGHRFVAMRPPGFSIDPDIGPCGAQSRDRQPPSRPGSQVASGGQKNTSISTARPNQTYGSAAWNTSFMLMLGGATPFIVNSRSPNGGVNRPSCMQIRNSTPNQIGSTPSCVTSGMKNGNVISIIDT